MLKHNLKEYLIVFLLLFFSGNPLAKYLFDKYSPIVLTVFVIVLLHKQLKTRKSFRKLYKWIFLSILFICFLQYLEFRYVSLLGLSNLLLKILIGGYIINYLGTKFSMILFKVDFYFSALSLVFFFLINIMGVVLPHVSFDGEFKSYILYNTSVILHMQKNEGMFWEPGAHAGILTLCLALNFNNLKYYWENHKVKLLVIILTLFSTQSTTGYFVVFTLVFFYFLNANNFFLTFVILPLIIGIGFVLYQSVDFLKEKINYQLDNSTDQEVGEFSNTRFGSLLFDWHYIQKHPFIGNGLDEKTRYADHQYLFIGEKGDAVGSGNGFSNNIACMGIFYVFGYFYLLWKSARKHSFYYGLVLTIVVLLNLQGEQWLNFPLYLGLPFLFLKTVVKKTEQKKNLIFKI